MNDEFCVSTCGAEGGRAFECSEPLVCDRYLGACDTEIGSRGADVGEACDAHEECRTGLCIWSSSTESPPALSVGIASASHATVVHPPTARFHPEVVPRAQ